MRKMRNAADNTLAGTDLSLLPILSARKKVCNHLAGSAGGLNRTDIRACAINDCNDIIDCMASITIRKLEETTKRKLKVRAAINGRSMEQEAREILKSALKSA